MLDVGHPALAESWIESVAAHVGFPSRRRARFLDELRDHLVDSTDGFAATGLDRVAAERRAVESMGSPYDVAEAFLREADAPSALTRAAGLALVATAILTVCQLVTQDEALGRVAEVFGFAGVVGMYFRQRYRLDRRGRAAFRASILIPLVAVLLLAVPLVHGSYFLFLVIATGAVFAFLVSYLLYLVATVSARVLPLPHVIAAHLLFTGLTHNPILIFVSLLVAASTTWLGLWLCCERVPVDPVSEVPDRDRQ